MNVFSIIILLALLLDYALGLIGSLLNLSAFGLFTSSGAGGSL